ncbi:MAG TPA: helix-turn-helix domain-containing protein, partial [Tepidimicrobium sp.]|nr:helix-turn-helix domain-containing protein [Tepidimicrobium sp.]
MEREVTGYCLIPDKVRHDNSISLGARLLYGDILKLSMKEGYCWNSNAYFAELYAVGKSTIRRWLLELEEKKYIQRSATKNEKGGYTELRKIVPALWVNKKEGSKIIQGVLKNERGVLNNEQGG